MSYDPKCYDLAEYFLPGPAEMTAELAQLIQDCIEDYLREPTPPDAA